MEKKKRKREQKKQKRMELLVLISQDPEWHKKENELTRAIQEKGKELAFPEQEFLMELTIENYQKLCDKQVAIKKMHRFFGISEGKLYHWRKKHGFCKALDVGTKTV